MEGSPPWPTQLALEMGMDGEGPRRIRGRAPLQLSHNLMERAPFCPGKSCSTATAQLIQGWRPEEP